MRTVYKDAYCRIATYWYEYDSGIGKPPDKKSVHRIPYKNENDLDRARREIVTTTYDKMYELLHLGMYDPIKFKVGVYPRTATSVIKYNGKPMQFMLAGKVYVFSDTECRYEGFTVEIDQVINGVNVYYPNGSLLKSFPMNGKSRYDLLEIAYFIIDKERISRSKLDETKLEGELKTASNNIPKPAQMIMDGFEEIKTAPKE